MEAIRKFPAKKLFETGLPHYDEIKKSVPKDASAHARPLVLIAPSWGPQSIFQAFGTDIVERIAAHYDVLVRPHPQMKVSQPEVYAKVLALEGVEVDTQRTPLDAMARADIVVSDISGIMHEFAFIYEKPVIIVDHEIGIGGLEGQLLGGKSDLKESCRDFITPIPPGDMVNIVAHIEAALERHDKTRLVEVREQLIYNFGHASRVAAEQVEEILRCS
jgi:CDP-glycerol glycerophosphotransferase (TagB/SpsB family)